MAQAPEAVVAVKRVAVDWDGTCVDDNKWPEMGDWLPGAVEGLRRLSNVFDEVVIWTCRTANVDTDETTPRENLDQIMAINLMLEEAVLPLNVYVWVKRYKPPAEVYIDNKALRFAGDWNDAYFAAIDAANVLTTESFETVNFYTDIPHPGESTLTPIFGDPGDEHVKGHKVRTFETGATRDTEDGKLDYEGFLSPLALRRYAQYMHEHRIQSDGTLRDSDNWQKGIPFDAYMKSGWRHFMDWWDSHRSEAGVAAGGVGAEDALCALIFNAMGYLHELQRGTLAP